MDDSRPRLLNLACCGGGSCHGYELAGFEVWGVDIAPQPHYVNPDRFIQADGLEVLADRNFVAGFAAVHMSWPCQKFTPLNSYNHKEYPDLIGPGRELALRTGLPYVMENVPQAPLIKDLSITLCGTMFPGARFLRHRVFETNWQLDAPAAMNCPTHGGIRCTRNGYLPTPEAPFMSIHGGKHSRAWQRKACEVMGTPWLATPDEADAERHRLAVREVCEAIPPAYTELIGSRLLNHIRA